MTQEQKELLKRDLCSRLDTNLVCSIYRVDDYGVGYRDEVLHGYCKGDIWYEFYFGDDCGIGIDDVSEIKPYLIPLSSMTEEQKEELNKVTNGKFYANYTRIDNCKPRNWSEWGTTEYNWIRPCDIDLLHTWLNQNHFDYRGLIEKGLAIEAPEGMYN